MTRETIQYKDLSVREPAPYGAAGAAWQANFKELADRIGPCNFTATAPPTANDDTGDGYATGSLWYDTAAQRVYWCASAATGAAVWIEISSSATAAITGGTITGITDLAVADGGTGASDAATARTNLGLGTIATQAANSVAITGGAIDGTAVGATTPGTGKFTTLTSGEHSIPSDTAGLRLDAAGTTVIYSNGTYIVTNKPIIAGRYISATDTAGGYTQFLATGTGGSAFLGHGGASGVVGTSSNTPLAFYTNFVEAARLGTDKTFKALGGYLSSDGTAGATADVAVAKVGGGTRTLSFKNGLYTGYTDS